MGRSEQRDALPGQETKGIRWPLLLAALLCWAAGFASPVSANADFGISAFSVTTREADGTIADRAGSHPDALVVALSMNAAEAEPDGTLDRIEIALPAGLTGNPLALPRCSVAEFPLCPGSTQIGILRGILAEAGEFNVPLYNLAPEAGYAAAFGVSVIGQQLIQRMRLSGAGSGSAIHLDATLSSLDILDVEEVIWGVPAAAAHDPERTCFDTEERVFFEGCASGVEPRPLLTLPASCAEPLQSVLTASSVGPPTATDSATVLSLDAGGGPRPLGGCESVPFDPRLTVTPDAPALAPSGLEVGLELPQYEGVGLISSASLSRLRLDLPPGLALNPSAAASLQGCEPAAVGQVSAPGALPPSFDTRAATCPARSRLGAISARTPLIDHPLSGQIYLAQPGANPFAAPFAIYLVIEDPITDTVLKFPGLLEPDPADGHLTAIVTDLPPFPFSDLELSFDGGPQAPLSSPSACGAHTATALITPSSAPAGFTVSRRSNFTLARAATGPCPPPPAERPATPDFTAGARLSTAGASTALLLRLSRGDADQHLGAFDLTLPPGLLAAPGAADPCSATAIASARSATGLAERNHPSCPAGSAIGSVRVSAGIGPQPLGLDGTVYMAGPYQGAPYSLAAVVPAQAGPYDLGTIVLRVALSLDPRTLQLSARSDRLPQILSGIPLELRSLAIDLDRPGLIRNPTSCEPMAITGTSTTSLGQSAPLFERFQVGDCHALSLRPRVDLRFSGTLARNGHPALSVDLTPRPTDANIAAAGFTLPASVLLDIRHLAALCPRSLEPEGCPESSRLGRLRLESGLLEDPLEGPIYLRRPSGRLPDLTADLRSGGVHVVLHGHTASPGGRLRFSFPSLPDVPLSRALITLSGGRRGIFVNNQDLCARPLRARAGFRGHNGRRSYSTPRVKTPACQEAG